MIVNSYHDITVFFLCFLCGCVTGFIFDFFRSLRKSVNTGKNMTAFQDALFCAIAFFLFTKTVDLTNDGDLRWYEFAGMFFGLVMYFLWISKFMLLIMTKICRLVVKILAWIKFAVIKIIYFIIFPFLYLGRLINSVYKSVTETLKQSFFNKKTEKE